MVAAEASEQPGDGLEARIIATLPEWSLVPPVEVMQALRGIEATVTLAAELGDLGRFQRYQQLQQERPPEQIRDMAWKA